MLIETELSEESLWEDSDTQAFYEHLPDLKAIMPAILKDNTKDDKVRQRLDKDRDRVGIEPFDYRVHNEKFAHGQLKLFQLARCLGG